MYCYVKFYEKDNELKEIHFPVQLRVLEEVNALGENSNTYDFNEINIILMMFTGSQESFSGSVYRFDYWQVGKTLNHIFLVLTDLINHNVSEF